MRRLPLPDGARRLPAPAALATVLALCTMADAARAAEGGSVTGRQGQVTASATWEAAELGVANPRLTIARGGTTLFDASPLAQSDLCAEGGCEPAASGKRSSPLQVVDLDGDGEPEVLLDVFSGGAHCCALTEVFAYAADAGNGVPGYTVIERYWGNAGYDMRDLDKDGRPELVGRDDVFASEFSAYAVTELPALVLYFDRERNRLRFVNATKLFPAIVRQHAKDAQAKVTTLRRRKADARGAIAAYVADLYLLGRDRDATTYLRSALKRGWLKGSRPWPSGGKFRPALLKFLRTHGYR